MIHPTFHMQKQRQIAAVSSWFLAPRTRFLRTLLLLRLLAAALVVAQPLRRRARRVAQRRRRERRIAQRRLRAAVRAGALPLVADSARSHTRLLTHTAEGGRRCCCSRRGEGECARLCELSTHLARQRLLQLEHGRVDTDGAVAKEHALDDAERLSTNEQPRAQTTRCA